MTARAGPTGGRVIGVDEALELVMEEVARGGPLPAESVPLDRAAGRILRVSVTADRDLPPFARSAMDGYALRAADSASAPVELEVVEVIPAGRAPERVVGPGQASRIMTGAPIPPGADAVLMVERTEEAGPARVRVLEAASPGQHVRRAGEELERGAVLLPQGASLDATALGLLASAGRDRVEVARRPLAAILPTGDELVSVEVDPGPAQIRESNAWSLEALARRAGADPWRLPIARDERGELGIALERACTGDVVLASGGVSMGDFDLVGRVLADMGCTPIFDRVAIQPGKPLFFGRMPRREDGRHGALVFGLPGNPVSSIVDFLVFARPALRRLSGAASWLDATLPAQLESPLRRRAGRRAYLPAVLGRGEAALTVRLLPSTGSADLVTLARADALAIVAESEGDLPAGVTLQVLGLSGLTG